MEKIKLLFQQATMISTGILWAMAIEGIAFHFFLDAEDIKLEWYDPLSIILTGFLCALPSLLLWTGDGTVRPSGFKIRVVCHFFLLFAIVALIGYFSYWYYNLGEFLFIAVMYCAIYAFVWWATLWLRKKDERKINEALKKIRDED